MPSRRAYWLLVLAGLLLAAGLLTTDYAGRLHDRDDRVAGCLRSQDDRRGLAALNRDVGRFADGASDARRADGNAVVAARYAGVATRSRTRSDDIGQRLPPNLLCEQAYPAPPLLPWTG